MFTVLIAEKEHIDAIRRSNRLFFEPFLDNHELAFCYWNPEGQTLSESVPGLADLVGRRKDWRAVIINAGSTEQLKKQNPFDFVDAGSITGFSRPTAAPMEREDWSVWEQDWKEYYRALLPLKEKAYREGMELPLTKLATWLCFCPSDYILEDVPEKVDEYDLARKAADGDEVKPSTRLEWLERDEYRLELRLKEKLRREFLSGKSINISHPAEVYCISQRITENGFFTPDPYWNIRSDMEYSEFFDRNMYYDKMRFMVFDILPATHRDYRCDQIRFLYAVLILATNRVPGSSMQARRLYLLDSENDDAPLCTLASSYYKKLSATYDVIENEIEKLRSDMPGELSDKEAETLFCIPAEVPISLDKSCDPELLYAENRFGLSSDCPRDELGVWLEEQSVSRKELAYILKQQDRVIRKSVDKLKILTDVPKSNISRLNSFQMDDIRDMTETAEDELVDKMPPDIGKPDRYSEQVDRKKDQVRNVMDRRMGKKTTICLGLFSLVLYLVCFLPFVLSNMESDRALSAALTLTGYMLATLAVVMIVTLFCLRHPLRMAVKEYNETMRDIMDDITDAMKKHSQYLSAVCNVRRGHNVMNYAEQNPDEYTKSIRIRRKHQEDIRRKRACLMEEYHDFIGGGSVLDHAMTQPYDYDFDHKAEYEYPAPFLAGDCHQIDFFENGNHVTVPSGFVTRITVKLEEIYDE